MIDAPEGSSSSSSSFVERLLTTPAFLSEGVLLQLALAFLLSPAHADPGLVAPLVALYALREDDRRAMMLYVIMSVAACPVDLIFVFSASVSAGLFKYKVLALLSLALKIALIYPAVKAHDALPSVRPSRIDPATLQLRVADVVEMALREEVQRFVGSKPPRARPPPPPPTAEAPLAAQTVTLDLSDPAGVLAQERPAPAAAAPPRPAAAGGNENWDEV